MNAAAIMNEHLDSMKRLAIAILPMLATPHLSYAAEMRAGAGQPFCQSLDDFKPYLMALMQKNVEEAQRYSCGGLTRGTRLVILEDLPSDSEIGHLAQVRAYILGGGGSIVGYTLIVAH